MIWLFSTYIYKKQPKCVLWSEKLSFCLIWFWKKLNSISVMWLWWNTYLFYNKRFSPYCGYIVLHQFMAGCFAMQSLNQCSEKDLVVELLSSNNFSRKIGTQLDFFCTSNFSNCWIKSHTFEILWRCIKTLSYNIYLCNMSCRDRVTAKLFEGWLAFVSRFGFSQIFWQC